MAQADKATAVADIAEQFKASTATVITEYRGLTVANLAELRRSLAGSATYSVAKNTLIKRAASDAGIEGLDQLFVGPTAIAFVSGEAVDAAKAIKKFAKDHKALVIKGGYMDGRALTVAEVEQIADLESREVLLAKLAGAMKANLSKAAGLFNAPASQVARLAAALQEKRAAEAPAEAAAAPAAEAPRPRRSRPKLPRKPPPRPPNKPRINQEGTHTMSKLSTDELLDAFKELTLLELSEFVKKFEETFEVTAAAPVAVAAAGPAAVARPPRPLRSSRSSTSSSRPPATRRSASSRLCVRSSPAWASRRPRTWSTARPSPCWRRRPRKLPRRPRPSSRPPAPPSPSSSQRSETPGAHAAPGVSCIQRRWTASCCDFRTSSGESPSATRRFAVKAASTEPTALPCAP